MEEAHGHDHDNWILIGRYVCDPAVFEVLKRTPPGRGGEIQLTDALLTLARMSPAECGQAFYASGVKQIIQGPDRCPAK